MTVEGETLEVLLVETIPGVDHQVERSSDLNQWETVTEHVYGLGHELAIGLREIVVSTPSGGSGGNPPTPPVSQAIPEVATVTLKVASGGGVVVIWIDSATSSSHSHLIAGQLDPAWASTPLAVWNFEDYMLVTLSPGLDPIEPPEVSHPSPRNQEVLDLVIAKLDEMNAAQAAQLASQINSPTVPPPPGPRQFFRVVTDWSLDSDGDGSLDWIEFSNASSGSGGQNGVTGDAFNADDGSILGIGDWEVQRFDGTHQFYCYVFWPERSSPPQKVGGESGFMAPVSYAALASGHPGLLSGGGKAIGHHYSLDVSEDGFHTIAVLEDRKVFSISATGETSVGQVVTPPYEFVAESLNTGFPSFQSIHTFYYGPTFSSLDSKLYTQVLDEVGNEHLSEAGTSGGLLFPTPGNGMLIQRSGYDPELFSDQAPWGTASLGPFRLFGGNGLGYREDGSFWFQGETYEWEQLVPGFQPGESIGIESLGRGGHILAEPFDTASTSTAWLGTPFAVIDNEEFTGVDATSLTSSEPGVAGDRYWVMVPAHGIGEFSLLSPAGAVERYRIANDSLNFLSDDTADNPVEPFLVNSSDPNGVTAALDEEMELVLTDGTHSVAALNSPIGMTIMPRRNLTVAIWPVAGWRMDGGQRIYDKEPLSGANEEFRAKLEEQLNQIYGKQVNAFFTVSLQPMITPDWDVGTPEEAGGSSGTLPPGSQLPEPYDGAMNVGSESEKKAVEDELIKEVADLHVVVMPEPMYQHPTYNSLAEAAGFNETTLRPRIVFVAGYKYDSAEHRQGLCITTAHELGHEFGLGHPDEGR
ncbi:hypothetical protein, partial [Roseibacillus persicicus]|uniref:hypothetical protein n=1 Tax=Roseibacillus persicicus TaxID=454148 RepID=UPI00280F88FF